MVGEGARALGVLSSDMGSTLLLARAHSNDFSSVISLYSGFMAPQVAGLEVGMRAVLEDAKRMSNKDWRVVPLDWNESLYRPGRKLRIGYYEDDGIFPATPGAKRALRVSFTVDQ